MLSSELTQEQKEQIADIHPCWMAYAISGWMSVYRTQWMVDHCPEMLGRSYTRIDSHGLRTRRSIVVEVPLEIIWDLANKSKQEADNTVAMPDRKA